MTSKPIFLSYLPADADRVRVLRDHLLAEGQTVYIGAGKSAAVLERAIAASSQFVACFSTRGHAAEELRIAVEQVRRAEHSSSWFVAIQLDACDVPEISVDNALDLRCEAISAEEFLDRRGAKRVAGRTEVRTGNVMGKHTVVKGSAGAPTDAHVLVEVKDVCADGTATVLGVSNGEEPRR